MGPDHSPDEYTLVEPVTSGGEGDVWRARRLEPDGRPRGGDWAIKMLLPGHPALSRTGRDPNEVLRAWDERWYKNRLDTGDLRAIPGVVVPTETFNGPAPHPAGQKPKVRGLYMATSWVRGEDLRHWGGRADHRSLAKVVADLCRIVDGLHDHGRIHGDISPGNVMVGPDGRVSLIDFTFMRFAELSRTTIALTPGYGAPESRDESTMATDAYAVAAVAYFLLTGQKLPTEPHTGLPARNAVEVAVRVLTGRGWSAAATAHIAAGLAPDPAARPVPLAAWGERLGELIVAEATQVGCVDVASDAGNISVMLTGSLLGLTVTGPWQPPPGGPSTVREVTAETDGAGRLVVFVKEKNGLLWGATKDRWHRLTDDPVHGPVVAVRDYTGSVYCYALRDDRMVVHIAGPNGDHWAPVDVCVTGSGSDIVAATVTPKGWCVVLVRDASGLHYPTRDEQGREHLVRVLDFPVAAAAVGTSRWGDLEVLAVDARSGLLMSVEELSGGWAPPEPVPGAPRHAEHLAVLDHREGRTVAVAGRHGLSVATAGRWSTLTTEPAGPVSLKPTRSWRNQLVAVVGGRAVLWGEDDDKQWVRKEWFPAETGPEIH
ncbi:protein kinase domain-containing protein [Actinomadura roseirufa]|uniref:protein kinase domain-containing protein n=1 Tax=Actinomadura roseirufa TaxID=2094049 RepID=UPI0010418C0E|nr:protein kinase [Actinomadura roseirufa]